MSGQNRDGLPPIFHHKKKKKGPGKKQRDSLLRDSQVSEKEYDSEERRPNRGVKLSASKIGLQNQSINDGQDYQQNGANNLRDS